MIPTLASLSVGLILALTLSGCGLDSEPTGPQIKVEGNNAPVTAIITDGSSSPVGTAPCGASSASKGNGQVVAPDCSVVEVEPSPIITPVIITP